MQNSVLKLNLGLCFTEFVNLYGQISILTKVGVSKFLIEPFVIILLQFIFFDLHIMSLPSTSRWIVNSLCYREGYTKGDMPCLPRIQRPTSRYNRHQLKYSLQHLVWDEHIESVQLERNCCNLKIGVKCLMGHVLLCPATTVITH